MNEINIPRDRARQTGKSQELESKRETEKRNR